MRLQLHSIDQAPHHIPMWDTILDDLGRPPAERVAKALGVGRATAYRWQQAHEAPRMACLALFWLTRWGRSHVDAQATNDARMAVGLAQALESEVTQLRRRLVDASAEVARLSALAVAMPPLVTATAPTGLAVSAWPEDLRMLAGRRIEHPGGRRATDRRPDPSKTGSDRLASFSVLAAVQAGAGLAGGLHPPSIKVVPEGNSHKGIEGYTHGAGAEASLFHEGIGQSDVEGHSGNGTILAPWSPRLGVIPSLLPPYYRGGDSPASENGAAGRSSGHASSDHTQAAQHRPAGVAGAPQAGQCRAAHSASDGSEGAQDSRHGSARDEAPEWASPPAGKREDAPGHQGQAP